MQLITIILVFAAAFISTTNGLCNTCGINGLACASGNSFQVCVDGIPQEPVFSCPGTTVCSSGAQICAPAGSSGSCTRCNICETDKTFACTNYTSFAFCIGSGLSGSYSCPTGLVCNVDEPNICVNSTEIGIGATCPFISSTTPTPATTPTPTPATTPTPTPIPTPSTTPNPVLQPNEYCASLGTPGRFEILSDTTCTRYISCILSGNGAWIGNLYVCPINTYFSTTAQTCSKTRPSRCARTL